MVFCTKKYLFIHTERWIVTDKYYTRNVKLTIISYQGSYRFDEKTNKLYMDY